MKKLFLLLSILVLSGFCLIQAQDIYYVSGYVTDELTGNPVANQDVHISIDDSTLYYSVVPTNQNGFYMDSIYISGATVDTINIFTYDLCTFGVHDTVILNPGYQVTADFQICVDTLSNPDCQADFYYIHDSTSQNIIYFGDLSTSILTIYSWTWSFGDGTTSSAPNPTHIYSNVGTYNVCLTIESSGSGGMCNDTYCMDVVIQNGGIDCVANFYYDKDSTGVYTVYQFYDLSTPLGLIETWSWDFGDGTSSTEQNPAHTYNTIGYFNVYLTITSDSGSCTASSYQWIYNYGGSGSGCQADFYYATDTIGASTLVYFYDSSMPLGFIESWNWDFGDGTTSTEQNPVHTYNTNGYFDVCLTITSDSGFCTSTSCQEIYIPGGITGECQADFYYINDSPNQNIIYFGDLSTSNLTIYSWTWSFGDGTTSTAQYPTHIYSNAGTYNVCFTIESADFGIMCTDTYCMDVVIQTGGGGDCEADFYYTTDTSGGNYTTVNFYDLSIPVGLVDSWYWDFGDGNTSTTQNPVHTYNANGVYNVCLVITADSLSCTSTYCDNVSIQISDNLYLGGNVFADIYQLDHGFAYAYQEENGVITEVFSDIIDSLGYYLFYPMASAEYYVKAEPSPTSAYFNTYMPTYYGDVAFWDDATLINLDYNLYTADINLVPLNQSAAGSGSIAGNIGYGSNNKANTPAVGIQIMLANEEGEFVGLAYSDEEGKFEFPNLAFGTFTLYAEIMKINMTPKDFTLTQENYMIDDISMIITDDEIYFGPDGIDSFYIDNVSEVYPNPIRNNLKLDIGIKKPTVITVKVHNQMGQTLIIEQFNMGNTQTIEVITSGLKSGMYFMEIIADDNYRLASKFIKQ